MGTVAGHVHAGDVGARPRAGCALLIRHRPRAPGGGAAGREGFALSSLFASRRGRRDAPATSQDKNQPRGLLRACAWTDGAGGKLRRQELHSVRRRHRGVRQLRIRKRRARCERSDRHLRRRVHDGGLDISDGAERRDCDQGRRRLRAQRTRAEPERRKDRVRHRHQVGGRRHPAADARRPSA